MKYEKGYIDDLPNESGVYTGNIDTCNNSWSGKIEVHGLEKSEVDNIMTRIVDELNGTEVPETTPNYAAAFNAWMDDYVNNPQAYESIYDTAMRHVSEKLGGYEASYGEVCAEVLVNYLNKLEQLALESK